MKYWRHRLFLLIRMESSLFEQMSMVKTIRFHSLREAFCSLSHFVKPSMTLTRFFPNKIDVLSYTNLQSSTTQLKNQFQSVKTRATMKCWLFSSYPSKRFRRKCYWNRYSRSSFSEHWGYLTFLREKLKSLTTCVALAFDIVCIEYNIIGPMAIKQQINSVSFDTKSNFTTENVCLIQSSE